MERFDESAIDWVAAAKRGISRRMLKEYGFLELLLEGGTTPVIPLTLTLADVTIKLDGTLRLSRGLRQKRAFRSPRLRLGRITS